MNICNLGPQGGGWVTGAQEKKPHKVSGEILEGHSQIMSECWYLCLMIDPSAEGIIGDCITSVTVIDGLAIDTKFLLQ